MSPVLRSDLLSDAGFAHGFSTRQGGVSEGSFRSLNLARNVGDDPRAVEENHERFARLVGYDLASLREATQVHGAAIAWARSDEDPVQARARSADALVAREPGLTVGVRTADCVPILLADPTSGAVGAIHAGWRGVVAGVIASGVEALGGPRSSLLAVIGPHIRAESFEVSEEVAAQIAAVSEAGVVVPRAPRPHVDLARAVRAQLLALGLAPRHVDDVGGDSFASPDRFHSYRRDAERSGRQLSVIVARGRPLGP